MIVTAPPYAPAVAIEQEVAIVHLPIQPAVNASQAASEGEEPLAVSAPQAAPEWEGSLELDWDASDPPAPIPSPRETPEVFEEPISAPVVQPDLELAGVGMSPPSAEIEAESTTPPSVGQRLGVPPSVVAVDTIGDSRPPLPSPPTEPRAMRNKGKGVARPTLEEWLTAPPPPRSGPRRIPLESRLTNPVPSLAEHLSLVSPPSLLDRLEPSPSPSNIAGPSSLWGPTNLTPPRGPRGSKPAHQTLAGLLATRPDPRNIPPRFAALLNRETPQQDGRQASRRWTVAEEDGEGSSSAPPEVTGGKMAEEGTQAVESSEVEMPDVETEESPLFALNIAASSGILHLVGREEALENQELPDVVQEDGNYEMEEAPRCWTTEDDDDIGMGPH
ncbi:hypothetical protein DFH08DRAFT_827560 [Mycena albidolilacea]|uniref:Uncharacterized protein n=1 Tax=Mycena albidolilacea TaxID=1033008 RepID=A0AAD6YXV4_9AGAR|nr:hypothetical protein DFH08DRAFT_827560 [Mycena albidolilacea]